MEADKSLASGSMALLVLKLLEDGDKYGYQMTSELRQRSEDVFHLKAGTLYPLLHSLEEKGLVTAYEREAAAGKPRRYYHLTKAGEAALREKDNIEQEEFFPRVVGGAMGLMNSPADYASFYHEADGRKVRHDQVHNLYGGSMTRAAGEAFADLRPGQRTLLKSEAKRS